MSRSRRCKSLWWLWSITQELWLGGPRCCSLWSSSDQLLAWKSRWGRIVQGTTKRFHGLSKPVQRYNYIASSDRSIIPTAGFGIPWAHSNTCWIVWAARSWQYPKLFMMILEGWFITFETPDRKIFAKVTFTQWLPCFTTRSSGIKRFSPARVIIHIAKKQLIPPIEICFKKADDCSQLVNIDSCFPLFFEQNC